MIFFIPYCNVVHSMALRITPSTILPITLTVMLPALRSLGLSLVTGLVVAQETLVSRAMDRMMCFIPYCIVHRGALQALNLQGTSLWPLPLRKVSFSFHCSLQFFLYQSFDCFVCWWAPLDDTLTRNLARKRSESLMKVACEVVVVDWLVVHDVLLYDGSYQSSLSITKPIVTSMSPITMIAM